MQIPLNSTLCNVQPVQSMRILQLSTIQRIQLQPSSAWNMPWQQGSLLCIDLLPNSFWPRCCLQVLPPEDGSDRGYT